MTYQEALDYINHKGSSVWKLGLTRTAELLKRVGNPQKQLKFVHVAGTNGKGSTCAMTENILRLAGYKTGFYPSPYIEDFRERIQFCGEMISKEDLVFFTEIVKAAADQMEDAPSHFELITAIGMLYFAYKRCDIVVLEVGLGGEFDSTNVIDAPEVAALCNIGLDHTEWLGDTVEKIAQTKCGIIKPGSSVASYDNVPSVMDVIREACDKCSNRLYLASDEKLEDESGKPYKISLFGKHQKENAKLVLAIIRALRDRGYEISEEAVREGLAAAKWPARFEVLKENKFILDGGHNPQCAEALVAAAREYFPQGRILFLMGMLADKDYEQVIDIIAPIADEFYTITPDSPRALTADELADTIREKGFKATAFGDDDSCADKKSYDGVEKAMDAAMASDKPVIAFGSLYAAGIVRSLYRRKFDNSFK